MIARATTTATLVITALAACAHEIPNPDQLELHRSAPQTLVLQNGGDRPLVVQPQTVGKAPLTVPQGGTARIGFEVLSVVHIELSKGGTRFRVVDGTSRNIIDRTDPAGYLKQTGSDATLRIGATDALPDEWRFALSGCPRGGWEGRPAPARDHAIDLANPPLPGVPSRICPKE